MFIINMVQPADMKNNNDFEQKNGKKRPWN